MYNKGLDSGTIACIKVTPKDKDPTDPAPLQTQINY